MSKTKQIRQQARDPILRQARILGFEITPGGKHWCIRHPLGGSTVVSYNGANKRSRIGDIKALKDFQRILDSHKNND